MPRFLEPKGIPFESKEVWLHFFTIDSHRMAVETDEAGMFYDCAVKGNDFIKLSWGYFSLAGLALKPGMKVICRKSDRRVSDVVRQVAGG